jgi:hypothetical protein
LRVNKLLAAAALPAVALGTLVALGGTAAARPIAAHPANLRPAIVPSGTMKVTPSTNLVDGEKVKVTVTGLGSTPEGIFVGQCDSRAAAGTQDPGYCDQHLEDGANSTTDTTGAGTFTITIHTRTGVDFRPTIADSKCSYAATGHSCILVAADDPSAPTKAAIAFLSFKNPATPTATTVKASKKKAAAKTNLLFTAKTTHKGKVAPTGKVTFLDNGKKFAVVKESKTGVVKAKHKIATGKNKIVAVYSGDKNNLKSTSKAVVVVGKKKK